MPVHAHTCTLVPGQGWGELRRARHSFNQQGAAALVRAGPGCWLAWLLQRHPFVLRKVLSEKQARNDKNALAFPVRSKAEGCLPPVLAYCLSENSF